MLILINCPLLNTFWLKPRNLPGGTTNLPGGTTNLPGGTGNLPGGTGNLPGGTGNLPVVAGYQPATAPTTCLAPSPGCPPPDSAAGCRRAQPGWLFHPFQLLVVLVFPCRAVDAVGVHARGRDPQRQRRAPLRREEGLARAAQGVAADERPGRVCANPERS